MKLKRNIVIATQKCKYTTCLILFILIFIFINVFEVQAQVGNFFNQRDDQYTLLGLKRAKAGYEAARAEYERKQQLFNQELISEQELLQAKNMFADAEVNYQQSLLSVLFEAKYVTVAKAVKYQSKDGKKHVKLKLQNTSGSGEFHKLVNIEEELFRSLQPDIINNVYVSLLNNENAIISQPYEAKIEELRFGIPIELDFILLQDLDMVTVNLVYNNGTQRSPKIYLEKDASVNKVIVQSQQFSQEVELGNGASFDLTLELFSGKNNTFKLEVVNLPKQINRYFIDPKSNARLSQFKFTESTNTREAALQVFLPNRPTDEVIISRPIPFYILIIPHSKLEGFQNVNSEEWTQERIEQLNVGYVKLEIVPRGIGKLFVKAPQLFYSVNTGEDVQATINIKNDGTIRLNNTKIETDLPLNWKQLLNPQIIPSLNIDEEISVNIQLIPPEDITPGKYEIRVRTSSTSDNQPVTGEDKTITVEILPEVNVFGTILIVIFIIGIISGIVIFGIRLTRK